MLYAQKLCAGRHIHPVLARTVFGVAYYAAFEGGAFGHAHLHDGAGGSVEVVPLMGGGGHIHHVRAHGLYAHFLGVRAHGGKNEQKQKGKALHAVCDWLAATKLAIIRL